MAQLHSLDTYQALANEAQGPARDWAATRLLILAPELDGPLPSTSADDITVALSTPRIAERLVAALLTDADPIGLAELTQAAGRVGRVPPNHAALVAALRARLGHSDDADLALAEALLVLDAVDAPLVQRIAGLSGNGRDLLLPALLIHLAPAPELVEALAVQLQPYLEAQPHLLPWLFYLLGLPTVPNEDYASPEAALNELSARWSLTLPKLPAPTGKALLRASKLCTALLADLAHPAAPLLRQLARKSGPWTGTLLCTAALLAGAPDIEDPVERALKHPAAPLRPAWLALAHDALDNDPEAFLHIRLALHKERPAAWLLGAAVARRTPPLAGELLRHLPKVADDPRAIAGAAVIAHLAETEVCAMLHNPETRTLGSFMASFCPTEAVLAALVALPLPAEREDRVVLGEALASMGDPATLGALSALCALDGREVHAAALGLAEDILHVPIDGTALPA